MTSTDRKKENDEEVKHTSISPPTQYKIRSDADQRRKDEAIFKEDSKFKEYNELLNNAINLSSDDFKKYLHSLSSEFVTNSLIQEKDWGTFSIKMLKAIEYFQPDSVRAYINKIKPEYKDSLTRHYSEFEFNYHGADWAKIRYNTLITLIESLPSTENLYGDNFAFIVKNHARLLTDQQKDSILKWVDQKNKFETYPNLVGRPAFDALIKDYCEHNRFNLNAELYRKWLKHAEKFLSSHNYNQLAQSALHMYAKEQSSNYFTQVLYYATKGSAEDKDISHDTQLKIAEWLCQAENGAKVQPFAYALSPSIHHLILQGLERLDIVMKNGTVQEKEEADRILGSYLLRDMKHDKEIPVVGSFFENVQEKEKNSLIKSAKEMLEINVKELKSYGWDIISEQLRKAFILMQKNPQEITGPGSPEYREKTQKQISKLKDQFEEDIAKFSKLKIQFELAEKPSSRVEAFNEMKKFLDTMAKVKTQEVPLPLPLMSHGFFSKLKSHLDLDPYRVWAVETLKCMNTIENKLEKTSELKESVKNKKQP